MKLLYIPCHGVLEYDQIRMWVDQGFEVQGIGSYQTPDAGGNRLRGPIPGAGNFDDAAALRAGGGKMVDGTPRFTKDFVERFDAIVVDHNAFTIAKNEEAFSARPVIRRTVGQTRTFEEDRVKSYKGPLFTVRYSERERDEGWNEPDEIIYFGKYLDDYTLWTNGAPDIVTFMKTMQRRTACPILRDYKNLLGDAPHKIYGFNNDDIPGSVGLAEPEDQLDIYATCKAYMYVHSLIACYTLNFLEALCSGCPIIYPSKGFVANRSKVRRDWRDHFYEIQDICAPRSAGIVYRSMNEGKQVLKDLDQRDLQTISANARATAAELFDAKKIGAQWTSFFERVL